MTASPQGRRSRKLLLPPLVALAILVMGLEPSSAAVPVTPIQPGSRVKIGSLYCTLNFVFRDPAGTLYIGTAGHCVEREGARAATAEGEFGTVVYRVHYSTKDFALIAIDPDKYGQVSPQVRECGGPTGYLSQDEIGIGNEAIVHGYGLVVSDDPLTRTRRGLVVSKSDTQYFAEGPIIFGDSGGPVLDARTGKAVGVVTGLTTGTYFWPPQPPSTMFGTTVAAALSFTRRAGFDLGLVAAERTQVADVETQLHCQALLG